LEEKMLSKLRWNKVLRDAWRHKARSALVVLAIALGVATFGMLLTARTAAVRDMVAGYWGNVPPNIILYLDSFDEGLLASVRHMPEVADAEARSVVYARVQAGPDEWVNLELVVLQDYADSRISIVRSQSGAWPPGRREVLMERSTPVVFPVAEGDTITVEMPGGAQKELRVSGFAHEFNTFSSYISRWARGFITMDTLEWLGAEPTYNWLYITVQNDAPDAAYLERVRNDVTERLEQGGYRVTGFDDFLTRPGKHWAYDFFSALMLVLGGVGTLSLLLSGFLVLNTTMALLAQETRQIGVMKAVGGQRGQIVGIYLSTVLLYGGIALALAVPLGLVCGRWFADFGSQVMNYDIVSYGLIPWVLALQVAMALGVPAVAALFPIYQGTRKTVREAISDYGISDFGFRIADWEARNPLARKVQSTIYNLQSTIINRPLMLSLRNTFRRKARLVLTLAALSLAGAVFIGVFSTQQSMLGLFDDIFGLFSYQVEVFFEQPVRAQRIEAVAARVPGIRRVESWLKVSARRVLPDDQFGMTFDLYGGPPDQQTVVPTMVRGRWLLPEDENAVVVSTGLLRYAPDLDVGDELTVDVGGRKSSWRIVGVVLMTGNGGGNVGYVNYPALAHATGMVGRATSAVVQIVNADDPLAQKTIARALEGQYERAGMTVASSEVLAESVAASVGQLSMVTGMLLAMAALLAVVGGLGLAATMGLNVLERTREIGVLRAIGASNRSVWTIVVAEGMLIGLFSWAMGTLLSLPVGNLLTNGVGMAFLGVTVQYVYSYPGVGLWLAVALVVSAVASLLPAYRASRVSVREALTYE
jgi:putative ABC transport system permease protein